MVAVINVPCYQLPTYLERRYGQHKDTLTCNQRDIVIVIMHIIDHERDLSGTYFADIVQEYTAMCLMHTDNDENDSNQYWERKGRQRKAFMYVPVDWRNAAAGVRSRRVVLDVVLSIALQSEQDITCVCFTAISTFHDRDNQNSHTYE